MKADKGMQKDELIALIRLGEKLNHTVEEMEKLLKMKGDKKYSLQRELLECKLAIKRM